jgi:uncharacterized protein
MADGVFCVPVAGNWLVFAPLCKTAAAVNKPAAVSVCRAVRDGHLPAESPAPLHQLVTELKAKAPRPGAHTGPARPPFLGLILTRGCNMACHYCDFAASEAESPMDAQLMCQALDGWAQWVREGGGRNLDLRFFGGEPFIEPDLVEIAVHRARCLAGNQGLSLRVEATTNGLLGSRMRGFVQDHFDAIVLSIDGPAGHHDLHRPLRGTTGSFAGVWKTAEALSQSHVKLCLRCCVSDATVSSIPRTARWFIEKLRPEVITFEAMRATAQSAGAGLKPPDPLQFARAFMDAWLQAREAGIQCVYAPLFDQPRLTFCPVGEDTFIVAPDRTVRSCYLRKRDWERKDLDLAIGRVEPDGRLYIDGSAVQNLRGLVAERARCRTCFCRWSCAGGCLVNETPPGHRLEHTDFCRQTRLLQACVLLHELGMPEQAAGLLGDTEAVSRLWEHGDDRLEAMQ